MIFSQLISSEFRLQPKRTAWWEGSHRLRTVVN